MIHIAVCDDDVKELESIHAMLEDILVHCELDCRQYLFSSATKMLAELQNVDIAILDISLKELNGIELGRQLKARFPGSRIIYITSYEQYCIQAINEVHAFSFLCKPLDKGMLEEQVMASLKETQHAGISNNKTFYKVSDAGGKKYDALKLDLDDIIYFEYIKSTRKIAIILENETYEFPYVMEKLVEELQPYGFAVNCRGNLVNLRHIINIKGYDIHMDNGKILALSQKRAKQFKEKMNEFNQNSI